MNIESSPTRDPSETQAFPQPPPAATEFASPVSPEPRSGREFQLWLWTGVLGALAVLWVLKTEYIYKSIQIGNAVPPIPALVILLLGGLALLFRSRKYTDGWRQNGFRVYLFLTIATSVCSTASLTFLFAQIMAAPAALRQPGLDASVARLPGWYAPPAGEVTRRFFEGSFQGTVPWKAWMLPLAGWSVFLFTLLLTLYALLALLRKSWMEEERLTYPIVQIPLRLVETNRSTSLWRSPLFWIGFGLAATFDGLNMLHAFYPTFPSFGTGFDMAESLANKPWNALSPLWVSYRPEILGIGYLMPTDVLFTVWVSYLTLRLTTVFRYAMGEQIATTAYDYQELGMGAFLCLFVLLLWRAMPTLKRSFSEALHGSAASRQSEPLSARAAWGIASGGPIVMLLWLKAAGLPLWIGSLHLFLLLAVAVVYARMRAETGTPMIYLFPFWQQQQMLFNFFGSQPFTGGNGQGMVVLASLGGLSRGYYPELCAYGAEGMSLAAQSRIPQRQVTRAFLGGVVFGLVFGGFLYLRYAYRYGADQLGGDYQMSLMRQQYTLVAQMAQSPTHPRPDLILQTFLGGWIALGMNWCRQRFLGFPFHPLGFAMASSYGYHIWAPFLTAWLFKSVILRWGGHVGYRRLLPLFLGIALGRYLFAGLLWGLLGMTGNPAVESYHIHFS